MNYVVLNFSPRHADGISQVVGKLIVNFDTKLKNELIIICNDISEPGSFSFEGVECINLKTKNIFILDVLFLYSRLVYSYKIYKFLKNNLQDGDIVNIHEGAGVAFFLSIFKKKIKNNFKIIISLHNSVLSMYADFAERLSLKYFLLKYFLFIWKFPIWLVEKYTLKNADFYIFLTRKTQRFCLDVYGIGNKYVVIPNGFDIEKRVKDRKGLDKKLRLLIVGSRTMLKGLDIAIDAVKRVNDNPSNNIYCDLSIIGIFDFNRYYKRESLPVYIDYLGVVKYENMHNWYKKFNCLILPSRSEDFPVVVLEALQNGMPFIVSRACNSDEIPGHEGFGYIIDSYCVDDWVEAIQNMKIRENYSKFVKNISSHDFSSFDWKNIARKYEEVYELMRVKTRDNLRDKY